MPIPGDRWSELTRRMHRHALRVPGFGKITRRLAGCTIFLAAEEAKVGALGTVPGRERQARALPAARRPRGVSIQRAGGTA